MQSTATDQFQRYFEKMNFETDIASIVEKVESFDPTKYGSTRNFEDGAVSRLSPYISRGVISTQYIFESLSKKGFGLHNAYKFIQELAWRDYWQQVWIDKGHLIDEDLKHPQPEVEYHGIPESIIEAKTGIEAVDRSIQFFYETGYIHNHMRMYLAAMACNVAKCHWCTPAKWMYYHLLDADWASNALSWQWVAGSNSNKKYYANQENINKFFNSKQQHTFLDLPYEVLTNSPVPAALKEIAEPSFTTALPAAPTFKLDSNRPTLIYNFYNLDPFWHKDKDVNRVLLLEPSIFEKYPVSEKSIQFMFDLSKNIEGIQTFVGSFDELVTQHETTEIIYKEHPLNSHYRGLEESRDWMFPVKGYFASFFGFWKKCEKSLKVTA